MALSADLASQKTRGRDKTVSMVVASGVTIFKGALVAMNKSTGFLVNMSDAANVHFLGVALSGGVGNGTTVKVSVAVEGLILEQVSVTGASAVTDVGDLVYATDSNTITLTAGTNPNQIGIVARYHSGTTCDVMLFSALEARL